MPHFCRLICMYIIGGSGINIAPGINLPPCYDTYIKYLHTDFDLKNHKMKRHNPEFCHRNSINLLKVSLFRNQLGFFCDSWNLKNNKGFFKDIGMNIRQSSKGGSMYLVFPVIVIIIVLLQCLSCSFGQT